MRSVSNIGFPFFSLLYLGIIAYNAAILLPLLCETKEYVSSNDTCPHRAGTAPITSTHLSDQHFTLPEDFDGVVELERTLAATPGRWTIEALLVTTLERARCSFSAAFATVEQVDGGVSLRCNVQDLDWIATILAGIGCDVVVYQPPELRDALRRLAAHTARIAERYK